MQTMYPPSKSHLYHFVLPFCTPEKIPEPVGRNRGPVDHVPGHTTAFGMCQGAATSSVFFREPMNGKLVAPAELRIFVWGINPPSGMMNFTIFFLFELNTVFSYSRKVSNAKKKLFETRTRLDQSAIQKGGRTLPRQGP